MEESKKPKTTAEVSLKSSLNDWQEVVYKYNEARIKRDYRFWDEMWNEDPQK